MSVRWLSDSQLTGIVCSYKPKIILITLIEEK